MAGTKKGYYEKRTGAWLWGEEIHCDYWRGWAWIWQRERVFPWLELPHHQRCQGSSVRASFVFATWDNGWDVQRSVPVLRLLEPLNQRNAHLRKWKQHLLSSLHTIINRSCLHSHHLNTLFPLQSLHLSTFNITGTVVPQEHYLNSTYLTPEHSPDFFSSSCFYSNPWEFLNAEVGVAKLLKSPRASGQSCCSWLNVYLQGYWHSSWA